MKNNYKTSTHCEKAPGIGLTKVVFTVILMMLTITGIYAQTVSGGWDAAGTNGTAGYTNYGSGVIQLLSTGTTTCAGAAVHETSAKYDPTSGTTFNKCYKVFFGCPGNDDIGSDSKGDGMAFSFSKCTYNINNGLACGGGLGYMGACSDNKMITIEFDTYSSQGNSGFDANYGGGTVGNNDEIALQRDGNASDAGRITSVNAGNLEDGMEHDVCISYNPTSHVIAVTIDGNALFSYNLTGSPYDLPTYFGAGGLNQTWSSGKYGATNPSTVSDGAGIAATIGAPLCPAGVFLTSPSDGSNFTGCPVGPITITASATPPAGYTVSYVEFFVDGASIGTDNTAPYSIAWNSPTTGSHALSAVAHWSNGTTSNTPSNTNITVGGTINLTSTPPLIDGSQDALWSSYPSFTLTQGFNNPPNLGGSFRIMYDANNLYVIVDVADNDLKNPDPADVANYWHNDGVEIYIDIGNDKATSYSGNDYQYALVWNKGGLLETKHGATGGVSYYQTTKAGGLGYIMEFSFPWSTLGGTPTPGAYIGFDVKLNDDDGSPGRDNQLAWKDGTFAEYNNPSLFGTLQFSNCNPLPVSLLNFTGAMRNSVTVLHWSTAAELNNKKFIIERSSNLSDWEAIGEVSGAGTQTALANYSFTDYSPLDGISYYRLRQIDLDGGYAYSNVVSVQKGSVNAISIAPNPFDESFTIRTTIQGDLDITIYDVLGREVYHSIQKNEEGTLSIQPDLTSGAYVVMVRTDALIEQQRIIKK